MADQEQKKVPVRRSRKKSDAGTITVKHRRTKSATHLVNLKESTLDSPPLETPTYQETVVPKQGKQAMPFALRLYKRIALSFVIIAVLVLAAVAYFATVKLDIVVTPKVMPVNATASFNVYDRPESYELPLGSVFGLVREMETEYSGDYPASGAKVIGAEVSGRVTIVNKYTKDQPLVATTRLLTSDNQLLRVKDTVVVPAGGSVEAEVYGESLDPSFTLADARLTIPGLWAGLQDKIYAEAKAGAVTYKEKKLLSITQEDINKAVDAAKQAIIEEAASEIESVYAAYDERLYEIDPQSLQFTIDAKAGEEKERFTIIMKAKISVVAFKKASLANLNETALDSVIGDGQSLLESSTQAPTFAVIKADVASNVAEVELQVDGESTAVSPDAIVDRSKLVGLSRAQIESYLMSLENIASYELSFSPSFFEVAPQTVGRISVRVK